MKQNKYTTKRKNIISKLVGKYGLICWYCGKDLYKEAMHIDHIIPKCSGLDELGNLALACAYCNIAKWIHTKDEFLEYLKYIQSDKFKSVF